MTPRPSDGRVVETCSGCGKKWDVKEENVPWRDKDEMTCTCGHVMHKWNGGITYWHHEHKG